MAEKFISCFTRKTIAERLLVPCYELGQHGGYSCTGFVKFLFRLCAIPTSNAAVERRFSAAALEQTALRNRLSATTMEKLLRVGALKEESDKESLE